MTDPRQQRIGVTYGLATYLAWGLLPLYFKAIVTVPALEILAHRIVWSLVLLLGVILIRGRYHAFTSLFKDLRTQLTLVCTTGLIAVNWIIFIWAVANDRVLEASLGYFINPLVNVLLGFVFLRERLRPMQTVAVALAAVSIVWMTIGYGSVPLISLTLAGSFGLYGLLRKQVKASGVQGLTAETLMLSPVALGYLIWLAARGEMHFLHTVTSVNWLLVAAGVITALPLIWFAEAARRLRLATMGFLQYLAPTGQLLLAVLVFGEPFTRSHAVSFGLIWAALALYTIDTVRGMRGERAQRDRRKSGDA